MTQNQNVETDKGGQNLRAFLDLVLRTSQLDLNYKINEAEDGADGSGIQVTLDGNDCELLLAKQGELLLAIEYLAHRWLRLEPRMADQVRFDCKDSRALRLEELKLSARVAAQRVRETGQDFRFNPMPSRERRIIHLELNGAPDVRTVSEGVGMRRHVVIQPVRSR